MESKEDDGFVMLNLIWYQNNGDCDNAIEITVLCAQNMTSPYIIFAINSFSSKFIFENANHFLPRSLRLAPR